MGRDTRDDFKTGWSVFMSLAYLGISYLIIFTPYIIPYNRRDNLPDNDDNQIIRLFLGIILFVYGVFRAYRIFKRK